MTKPIREQTIERLTAEFGDPVIADDSAARWSIEFPDPFRPVVNVTVDAEPGAGDAVVWIFDPRQSPPDSAVVVKVRDLSQVEELVRRIRRSAKRP